MKRLDKSECGRTECLFKHKMDSRYQDYETTLLNWKDYISYIDAFKKDVSFHLLSDNTL